MWIFGSIRRAATVVTLCLVTALGVAPITAHAQDVPSELLARVNNLRTSNGLGALSYNGVLAAAAQGHANYLASTEYIHPHRERNGSLPQDRANAAGYSGRVGENVVGGSSASLDWAFQWWMNSGVHYRNMLGNWTEMGVGYADGGNYGRWYVTVFGNEAREAAPAEGFTGVGPIQQPAGSGGGASGGSAAAGPPAPTRRPAPTWTPTITLTPSLTYTPRPTHTPTDTGTPHPPTGTAIVLEISPQPSFVLSSTLAKPSATLVIEVTPTEGLPTMAPLIVAEVAMDITDQPAMVELANSDDPPPGTSNGSPVRDLLPWAIVVQGVVVCGLVISALLRRR